MLTVLAESDELLYRAAFAAQKTAYVIVTEKGEYDVKNKYNKTQIINDLGLKGKALGLDYELKTYLILDSEGAVEYTLKHMLNRLWQISIQSQRIKDVRLFVSPSDGSNFRHKVATIAGPRGQGYKAGRSEKPHYYGFIKDLLINEYKAEQCWGFEADDFLGIHATKDTVLSHIDKDIDMIGGCWHYNHVKGETYYVDDGLGRILWDTSRNKIIGRGLLFFYVQLLTGDQIDNIPGCKNSAKVHHTKVPTHSQGTAHELLAGVKSEQQAFDIVRQAFEFTYGPDYQASLEECADLLWICKSKEETGRQYLKNQGFID